MRYALIGCGRISPNHIAAATNNDLEIVAICDVLDENMENIITTFKLDTKKTKKYLDYNEMLANEKLDLVAIATESGKHFAIAMACLAKKVNVIIEKPITLSLEEADQLIALAKKNKVVVGVNHQNRFNKSIQKIKEAMDKDQFGRLFYGTAHIRWNRNEDYYIQAPWRGTWEQDGGALMNQCIHNIDLLRWLMGDEVDEVFAYTAKQNHPYIAAEDLGIALIKFKNGAYGIIEGTTNIFPKNLEETLYLFGEKGTVKAGGKSVNLIEEWLFSNDSENPDQIKAEHSENPQNVYGFGHTPLYKNVIEAIKSGKKPLIDGEAGKRALELVLAIYQSAKDGKPVKLPLKKCAAIDFKGLFE